VLQIRCSTLAWTTGLGPHRGDRFRESLEAVADHDARVGQAAVLDLGEHVQPVLGAFAALADPDAEDVAVPVHGDADDHVEGPEGGLSRRGL
jgi:hypothetical protein